MLVPRIAPLLLLSVLLAACAGPSASDASVAPPRVGQDPSGLGFAFLPTSTGLLVRVLADDGPADAAGLRERDVVTAVSGREMAGLSREAIAEWLGLAGSGRLPVVLDVLRGEASLQVTLTPAPYDRAALMAETEARFPSGPGTPRPPSPPPSLDDLPELTPEIFEQVRARAMAQFSEAMSQSIDGPRAERDGTHLVITSPDCVIRIPVTERATPESFFRPIDGSLSRLRVASTGTGVYCTDVAPNYQDLSSFTFPSVADRDRAIETGRHVLRVWPRDAFAPVTGAASPPPAPRPLAPASGAPGQCISGNCENGRGTWRYPSGSVFAGTWVDHVRSGQGTYTWGPGTEIEGAVYVGAWADDTRHGQGVMTWRSGQRYEGAWAAGTQHGEGTMTYSDGRVYTGDWHEGKWHGRGTLSAPSGASYVGDYVDDQRVGWGTLTYTDGRIFIGRFAEDKPSMGTLRYPGEAPRSVRVENGEFVFMD